MFASYPDRAGWKAPDTSREAARKLEASGRAEIDRTRVLFALRRPATCKELAALLDMDINNVRPRVSQLFHRHPPQVEKTGARRNGECEWVAV